MIQKKWELNYKYDRYKNRNVEEEKIWLQKKLEKNVLHLTSNKWNGI